MSYTDFLRCFTRLSVCHILDITKTEDTIWTEKKKGGCGNDDISSFLTNPQYLLTIREDAKEVEVNIALMQKADEWMRWRTMHLPLTSLSFHLKRAGLQGHGV